MPKANEDAIEEHHMLSPKGKYEAYRKHVADGLCGKERSGEWGGGHPFDVELCRMPAGKRNYPLHGHAAAWEYYIILSGTGHYRTEAGEEPIREGDHIIAPRGEARQLINDGDVDLVFYVIATSPRADVVTYPDSDKRLIAPKGLCFEPKRESDYKGEE